MKRRLVLCLLFAALPVCAQKAAYRIAGTVVSSVDGHALQHAQVEIRTGSEAKPVQTTISDEYGRFVFDGVPAGVFELQGEMPGYLPTRYQQHGVFSTGIVTGAGVDTGSLMLRLLPTTGLMGVIANDGGEPIDHAIVHLFVSNNSPGLLPIRPAGLRSTDDLGHFEFPSLRPGEYYIAVTAQPWYAVHANLAQSAQNAGASGQQAGVDAGFTDSIDPSLDVAYPTTYYPSVIDVSSASPIGLRAGEPRRIDIQMTAQPAYSITVPLAQPRSGRLLQLPQVHTSIFGQDEFLPIPAQAVADTAVVQGVPAGDYSLVMQRGPDSAQLATPIHIGDQSIEAELAAPEAVQVQVTPHSFEGSDLPANLAVAVMDPATQRFVQQSPLEKGHAVFHLVPGEYEFQLRGNRPYAVREIVAGGKRTSGNETRVAEAAAIELLVSPTDRSIQGRVRKAGKPLAGAFLLLLPAAEAQRVSAGQAVTLRTFWRQQSELDGSFTISGLAPGDYALIAVDDGWDLDWKQPSTVERYLKAAVSIHVPDGPRLVVSLQQPVSAQIQ